MFNHTSDTLDIIACEYDWDDFNGLQDWVKRMGEHARLIQIINGSGQVSGGNHPPARPDEQLYFEYLNLGFMLALTADQDNHEGNWGTATPARTAIIAEELAKPSLLEAIRERHVYATEDENLRAIVRINGYLCGDILAVPEANSRLTIIYDIADDDELDADYIIRVFGDSIGGDPAGLIDSFDAVRNEGGKVKGAIDDNVFLDDPQYIFFKTTQLDEDGQQDDLWTSPIWFHKQPGRDRGLLERGCRADPAGDARLGPDHPRQGHGIQEVEQLPPVDGVPRCQADPPQEHRERVGHQARPTPLSRVSSHDRPEIVRRSGCDSSPPPPRYLRSGISGSTVNGTIAPHGRPVALIRRATAGKPPPSPARKPFPGQPINQGKQETMSRTKPQSVEESDPKTTRPDTTSRRDPEPAISTEQKLDRRLDAFPDRVDVRDWFYQPSLSPLPDRLVNCHLVPEILDQGREGACTGYALAAVINFLLNDRGLNHKVSPRMLYEMARRYDEWPGEEYEGSSARGTMIGWAKHGACSEGLWPASLHGPGNFTQEREDDARATPGGAFYRVMHRQVRDMHSALNEVGILYATLMVHAGWDRPGPQNVEISYSYKGSYSKITLPVIRREGSADRGHAIAIVGYTHQGFIIQNSWGPGWGKGGFALLPYEDYMLHATDVWVAQLGVPVDISLWVDEQGGERLGGLQRATRAIPLSEIRPYVVDIGEDGKLSMSGEYWTTEEDLERLFAKTIPEQTKNWSRRRVMLYLHGGLNDEATAARRIVAFRDVCKANEIYPLHIMWETGTMETLKQIIGEWLDLDRRAGGVGDWLEKVREGAIEAKDRTLELTAALPGTALWNKMNENARAASNRIDGIGGMQLIVKHVRAALDGLDPADRRSWDLHVVGHSAGTIFAVHALHLMQGLGITFKTLQFMAPAITVEGFKELVLPAIAGGSCPIPSTYVLSDVGERDDDVGPYGKSLLYLVSNAFERRREEPILGMHRFISSDSVQRGEQDRVDPAMDEFFRGKVDGLPALVVSGRDQGDGCRSRSDSHGGFDNDPDTLNSVLFRILGGKPKVEFVTRDFQF